MHLEDYRLFDTKVFRDVVHDYIHVEYMPIWKLINTKEFQRLRRIKQLGGDIHGISKCRTFTFCAFLRCL